MPRPTWKFSLKLPFGEVGTELPTSDLLRRRALRPVPAHQAVRIRELSQQVVVAVQDGQLLGAIRRLLALADEFDVGDRDPAIVLSARAHALLEQREDGDISDKAFLVERAILFEEVLRANQHFRSVSTASKSSQQTHAPINSGRSMQRQSRRGEGVAPYVDPELSVVRCDSVTVRYKNLDAVKNVSFQLGPGEVLAVVGRNGAGKSTLLRVLARRLLPTAGNVTFPSLEVMGATPADIQDAIGYSPQEPEQFTSSVFRSLRLYGALRGAYSQHPSGEPTHADEVDSVVQRFELASFSEAYWGALSAGFRTRYVLARLLLGAPALLILDEPLAPLDASYQRQYLTLLRDLSLSRRRLAIVVSSHDVRAVESIASKTLVLERGAARYEGPSQRASMEREVSHFELGGTISASDIERALTECGPTVQLGVEGVIVALGKPLFGSELLGTLARLPGRLTYFRDLTNSAERLLMEPDDVVS
jgi:ABC-2 type transport system ATP-binding protein